MKKILSLILLLTLGDMKKILSLILLLTLGASVFEAGAFEREDYYTFPNDLTLTYGVASVQTFTGLISGIFMAIPSSIGGMQFDGFRSTGAIGVSYQRSLGKTVSLGVIVNYDRVFSNFHDKSNAAINGKFSMDWYTAMASLRLYWFKNPGFAMYSKFAAGAFLMGNRYVKNLADGTQERSAYKASWGVAAQLSPVSMEFGGRLRGFVELGIGMEGCLVGGLKYYF